MNSRTYLQPFVFRFVNFAGTNREYSPDHRYAPKTVKVQAMGGGIDIGVPRTYKFQYPNVTEIRSPGVALEGCPLLDSYKITVCFVDPDGDNFCMNSSINIVPFGKVLFRLPGHFGGHDPYLDAIEASPPRARFKLLPPSGIELSAYKGGILPGYVPLFQ